MIRKLTVAALAVALAGCSMLNQQPPTGNGTQPVVQGFFDKYFGWCNPNITTNAVEASLVGGMAGPAIFNAGAATSASAASSAVSNTMLFAALGGMAGGLWNAAVTSSCPPTVSVPVTMMPMQMSAIAPRAAPTPGK